MTADVFFVSVGKEDTRHMKYSTLNHHKHFWDNNSSSVTKVQSRCSGYQLQPHCNLWSLPADNYYNVTVNTQSVWCLSGSIYHDGIKNVL